MNVRKTIIAFTFFVALITLSPSAAKADGYFIMSQHENQESESLTKVRQYLDQYDHPSMEFYVTEYGFEEDSKRSGLFIFCKHYGNVGYYESDKYFIFSDEYVVDDLVLESWLPYDEIKFLCINTSTGFIEYDMVYDFVKERIEYFGGTYATSLKFYNKEEIEPFMYRNFVAVAEKVIYKKLGYYPYIFSSTNPYFDDIELSASKDLCEISGKYKEKETDYTFKIQFSYTRNDDGMSYEIIYLAVNDIVLSGEEKSLRSYNLKKDELEAIQAVIAHRKQ